MQKKFFLILAGEPYTEYYYKKFSVLRKKDKLIQIKVWCLLPLLNRNIFDKYFPKNQHKIYKDKNFIYIENVTQLREEFKKLPKYFYFTNFSPKFVKSLLIERFLYLAGGKKIFLQFGGIPQVNASFIEKLKFRLTNFNFLSIIKILRVPINFLSNLMIKILTVNPNIYFVPNKFWFKKYKKNKTTKNVFKINDYEYEVFKNLKKKENKKNLIVFIDEMKESPYDHDLYWGFAYSFILDSEEYWKNIDSFLKKLQIKTKCDVVIAGAHRRRNRDFPIKRKFIMNKTPELIQDSKLVVGHSSTALHYAILFKKPILLLDMYAFKNKHTDFLATKKFCELLGCTEIHLEKFLKRNNEFKLKNILKVDNKKYNKFIKNFLKFENSYKITIWDKVLSELKFNKNI